MPVFWVSKWLGQGLQRLRCVFVLVPGWLVVLLNIDISVLLPLRLIVLLDVALYIVICLLMGCYWVESHLRLNVHPVLGVFD